MTDLDHISDEIGTGQPMAIMKARNDAMKAWDLTLLIGGFETEERAMKAADLLKEILIRDGFAKRLERIQ